MAIRAVEDSPLWDQLNESLDAPTKRTFERTLDQFSLDYSRSVVSEMSVDRAREFLDLSDWLAATKDLNQAVV